MQLLISWAEQAPCLSWTHTQEKQGHLCTHMCTQVFTAIWLLLPKSRSPNAHQWWVDNKVWHSHTGMLPSIEKDGQIDRSYNTDARKRGSHLELRENTQPRKSRGWAEGDQGVAADWGKGFFMGWWRCSGTKWWLEQLCEYSIPKTSELYFQKSDFYGLWIVCPKKGGEKYKVYVRVNVPQKSPEEK